MILFLFGQWGAGESTVAHKFQAVCPQPHLDADTLFPQNLVDAVKACTILPDQMGGYYAEVGATMAHWRRHHTHFLVTQGIYTDAYRRALWRRFQPEIQFVLVVTPDPLLQRRRIAARAHATGNPVSLAALDHMARYWEPPTIPHQLLYNDNTLDTTLLDLLRRLQLAP